jgi:hypothetical protein
MFMAVVMAVVVTTIGAVCVVAVGAVFVIVPVFLVMFVRLTRIDPEGGGADGDEGEQDDAADEDVDVELGDEDVSEHVALVHHHCHAAQRPAKRDRAELLDIVATLAVRMLVRMCHDTTRGFEVTEPRCRLG